MTKLRILVTCDLPGDRLPALRRDDRFSVTSLDADGRRDIPGTIAALAPHGIVSLLSDTLGAAEMATAPDLKVIANYAVGYNNIDTAAAKERGIVITNTPDVLTDATADIAFLLILSVSRRAWEAENFMREGRFTGWLPDLFLGLGLQGKLLGILGYGRIGSAVARRGRAFGMRIAYHARNRLPREREAAEGIEYLPLDRLIAQSDVLSLHMPYTPAARHLIDAKALDSMRPTAILINTARGPLVDETALLAALKERRIFGAGFDVYEHEPRVDPALLALPNVSVLPHIGSATVETRAAMAAMAIDDCVAVLTGATPRHRVV